MRGREMDGWLRIDIDARDRRRAQGVDQARCRLRQVAAAEVTESVSRQSWIRLLHAKWLMPSADPRVVPVGGVEPALGFSRVAGASTGRVMATRCRCPWSRSLGHPHCGHWKGACCWDPAGAGVTARGGCPLRALMTPPPPVLAGPWTGDRGTRRRAPVSDRPVIGLLAGSSFPP